jgi:hypothetical protein
MSWLRIIHETTYSYKAAVCFGPHRLVLRPREGHDVRVEKMRLEIVPECELEWSRDLFGNSVATVHFLSASDHLHIRSEVLLQQTVPFPLRSERPSTLAPFPVAFSVWNPRSLAYQATSFPEDVVQVRNGFATQSTSHPVRFGTPWIAWVAPSTKASDTWRVAKGKRRPKRGPKVPDLPAMATLMLEAHALPTVRRQGCHLDCAALRRRASTHA